MQNFGPSLTFQHDNAGPHTSLAQNMNILPWLALSPDMNPTEHIWDEFGRRARTSHQIKNVARLNRALQLEWQAFPKVLIRHSINPMRWRIRACIASNGSHTRY